MAAPTRSCCHFGIMKRIKFSHPAPQLQRLTRSMATVQEPAASEPESAAPQTTDPTEDSTTKTLNNLPVPLPIRLTYLRPLRRTPTHGLPICNLQLRSYNPRTLDFFADFALRAAYFLNLPAKGPVPLPRIVERWTVPRAHFAYKKSQENFERRTLRRLIQIQDGDRDTVGLWLAYLEKRGYHGVGMKANVWEYEGMDALERLDKQAEDLDGRLETERLLMVEEQAPRKGEASNQVASLLEENATRA